ncbi:MAG TPA: hypothetical protein VFK94_06950 [Patescibacteria group bacterium]|nr:hypothetical protein [Patescibacteria group bacterium]
MASLTALLGLRKPDPTDNVNVTTDISDNMELIDDYFAGRFAVTPGRNAIRNGDMGVAQRGDGAFTTTDVYTTDGWRKEHIGGTHSITRSATGMGSGPGLNGARASLQSVVSGQSAVSEYARIIHRIESVRTLAGKQVTLSFLAAAGSGTPKLGISIEQYFGTGGTPSATVDTAIQAITLSTSWTVYSVTFTVPSISGKTLGTSGNDFLQICFWYSAGTNFAARASSIGIQNATIDFTDVQLEAGSVATAFERLPQQVQLAWCQRYFQRFGPGLGLEGWGVGIGINTTQVAVAVPLIVEMRAVPTLSESSNIRVTDTNVGFNATAHAIDAARTSRRMAWFTITTAGTLTAFRPYTFEASTAAGYFSVSAEL